MQPTGGEVDVLLALKSICCQALTCEALGDSAWEVTSGHVKYVISLLVTVIAKIHPLNKVTSSFL